MRSADSTEAAGDTTRAGRPAALLDRDGTIIQEREYLSDPEGVGLVPGAVDAMRAFTRAGYAVVIVTNQSGIARGLYTEADFRAVQRRLEEMLERRGVRVDGVYHCPHHPEVTGPCACRKPGTGMYRRAAREHGLDLAGSVFVGDRLKDVVPAREFGGIGILVRTGYGSEQAQEAGSDIVIVRDVAAAAEHVLRDR